MRLILALVLLLIIIFQTIIILFDIPLTPQDKTPIKVGLIYSTTGFRAPQEIPVQAATLLAIEEINQKGGLLGRKIVPIKEDAQSSRQATQKAVERLIVDEDIKIIFGCWAPSSHYTIKEIFEKYNCCLITPFQYEGVIDSPNIIFVGATANQLVPITVNYCLEHIGKRFFLIGSDYVFARIINRMIQDQLATYKGEILGENYIPFYGPGLDEAVAEIIKTNPDVILNSLIGSDNAALFKKLKEAGIQPEKIPTFSFSLSGMTIGENIEDMANNYASANYFQSIDTPINKEFVANFKQFSGLNFIDNSSEAAYLGVYLWAKAVQEAKKLNINDFLYFFADMRIEAPEGTVIMDIEGRHAWKHARIAKIQSNGQFEIIWESPELIRPISHQLYRAPSEWNELVEKWYENFKVEQKP